MTSGSFSPSSKVGLREGLRDVGVGLVDGDGFAEGAVLFDADGLADGAAKLGAGAAIATCRATRLMMTL